MGVEKDIASAIIPSQKIYYLDHVKLLLTVLVVLHHVFIAYGGHGGWYYKQSATNLQVVLPLTILVSTNQSFFMGLFFLLSAYFIEPSLKRKGVKLYLTDRFKRLGIPLLFCSFLISPIINYLVYHFGRLKKETFIQYFKSYNDWLNFGVLWFVVALLLFTLIFLTLYQLKLSGHASISKLRARSVLLFAVVLGLVTYLVRIPFPADWALQPVGFHIGHFPQYIAMFIIGILASRGKLAENLDLKTAQNFAWFALVLLLFAWPFMAYLKVAENAPELAFNGGWNMESLVYSIYEQLLGISIMVALTGISKAKWNKPSVFLSRLSRNSFAVYILHPLILVTISLFLSRIYTTPTIKLIIAAPAALISSFIITAGIMRVPGVNKII
jgi:surface polysaccharide O-acyltransferase-like enzyme